MSAVNPKEVPGRAQQYTDSILPSNIPDEAELTAGTRVEAGGSYGFFTDTSLCIGCKACEVACKEWNNLPADELGLTGHSYDNTNDLSANTWRHVAFIEQIDDEYGGSISLKPFQSNWLMMSDVCKHCQNPGCMQACPTGALFRTEFDTVVVQQDICNGCGYCVPSCPFGVVATNSTDGKAHKCTLCYDRLKGGIEPACAKSCPTNSIQFGPVAELQDQARQRVQDLHDIGRSEAYLYGVEGADGGPGTTGGVGDLNCFFLLMDQPEVYNLPTAPTLPSTRLRPGFVSGFATALGLAVAAGLALSRGR
jgi:formate dehydrogenase iron-sulfur subunit